MGTSKAWLEWDGGTLLAHTLDVLAAALDGPLVVVRAAGQELPALPDAVEVLDDEVPDRGPLPAIGTGLGRVADRAAMAFVASVDMPLLHPAFVARVLDALSGPPPGSPPGLPAGPAAEVRAGLSEGAGVASLPAVGDTGAHDVALPVAHGHHQPLAAAYRTSLAGVIGELVQAGIGRPPSLFDRVRVLRLDEPALLADRALAGQDPDLDSLTNVNTPAEYRAARARHR